MLKQTGTILIVPYKNRVDLYKAQKRHRVKIRALLFDFLNKKQCRDCGENDPRVLDFDNRDPKEKFKSISQMLSGHYSWIAICREIEKCEIRCANCHRRKTYIQLKFFGKSPRSLMDKTRAF